MWGFTPKWVRLLPEHLRPDSAKIKVLEDLRKRYEMPHEMLAAGIANSEQSTLRTQHHVLKQSRARMPANASERDLWFSVLASRAESALLVGNKPMDADEIMRIFDNAKSFEDICEAIISYERPQRVPDMSGIQDEVDALLAGRFSLIACSKCSYEFPLLQGLFRLQGAFSRGMMATCPKCSNEFVPNTANIRTTPNVMPQQKQQQETTIRPTGDGQSPTSAKDAQHQEKKDFDEWPPRKLPR